MPVENKPVQLSCKQSGRAIYERAIYLSFCTDLVQDSWCHLRTLLPVALLCIQFDYTLRVNQQFIYIAFD